MMYDSIMTSGINEFNFDQDNLTYKAKLKSPEGLEDFIQSSFDELQKMNAEMGKKYGIGTGTGNWSADLLNGTATFFGKDSGTDLVADIEVIGSVNTDDDTFMWACDNESFSALPGIVKTSAKTKDFLDDLNYLYMWESPFNDPQYKVFRSQVMGKTAIPEAWRLSAVANRLSSGLGIYSANISQTQAIFLLIKDIR
jgi:hypothetical protein